MRVLLPVLALGCTPGPGLGVSPAEIPLSGYVPVTLDLSASGVRAGDVRRVVVGGVSAYDLRAEGADELVVTVQGAPEPGPQDVVLHLDDEVLTFPDALIYAPPIDPAFGRLVALGASITQGVQGGVPTHHAILHSPPRLVARALGTWFPVPLLVEGLFPSIDWSTVGPPPACEVPSTAAHVARAAAEVLAKLEDEDGAIAFHRARVDPDLTPHDVAVGDSHVATLLHGAPGDFVKQFLAKLVLDPYARVEEDVTVTQIELVEALDPDVIVVADTYGNDLIRSIVLSRHIDARELTPLDAFEADLEELVARLAATGAEVFLANMPRPTVLPVTSEKRDQAIARADDPEAEAARLAAELAVIDEHADLYEAALDEIVARHANVHVVDFRAFVERAAHEGVEVDGVRLTVEKFGGLLSTDGVHLSDVGNGLVAQLFLDAIADVFGVEVPAVDLSELLAGDPYSPAAAEAAGFDRSACAIPDVILP